jgi:hypothetical protein
MEDSEVEFEEVEVQEWVCKKAPPTETRPIVTEGETSTNAMDIDPIPATDPSEPKQYSLVKIVHTKLFCPMHNAVSRRSNKYSPLSRTLTLPTVDSANS